MTITIAQDTCIRANQSGLGTASDGETWAIAGAGTGSIVSNRGQMTNTSGTGANRLRLGSGTMLNGDITERMSLSSTTDNIGFIVRWVDANNYVQVSVANGSITVRVIVANVGTNLTPTTGITLTASTNYQLHINLNNNVYSINVWLDGNSEPAGWVCQATDGVGSATRKGQYGPYASIGTINDIILFDSFLVTSTPPTIYVSPTGNDSTGNGSKGNPYLTISKADTMVPSGGTVRALPGTYTVDGGNGAPPYAVHSYALQTLSNGTPFVRIQYISDTPQQAKIISTGANMSWRQDGNYVDIIGFDVTSSNANWGISIGNDFCTVQACYVHDYTGQTIEIGQSIVAGAGIVFEQFTATNNWALGNKVVNIYPTTPSDYVHGIYLSHPGGGAINNIAVGCSGGGINAYHYATAFVVANNLCINNRNYGIGIACDHLVQTCTGCTIVNNIIRDNRSDGNPLTCWAIFQGEGTIGAHNTYKNNLIYGGNTTIHFNSGGDTPTGTLNTDPQFVNYQIDGSGDYHLLSTSPCIDAGTATGAPTTDFDGNARPRDYGYDIGPYECFGIFSSYDTRILQNAPSRPMAYYRVNDRTGTSAHDSSGNGYHGTLSGSVTFAQTGAIYNDSDPSILFAATASLNVPPALNYTTFSAFSLDFWINTGSGWHYIAVTSVSTTTLTYYDGILTVPGVSGPIEIDSIFSWAGSSLAADLAKIGIYNYVLTPAEILARAQLGRGFSTGTYNVAVGNSPVFVIAGSLNFDRSIGKNSQASFNVQSDNNTHFQQDQQVQIYDASNTLAFSGYVTTPKEEKPGFQPSLEHTITCTNQHRLAEKRLVAASYVNKSAGYMVNDIFTNILASEGVTIGLIYDSTALTDLFPGTGLFPSTTLYPTESVGIVPEATFVYCTVAQAFDALVTAASANGVPYYWMIDHNKALWFAPYTAVVNSTLIDGTQIDDGHLTGHRPTVTRANPTYRNTQYLLGGVAQTVTQTNIRVGDGNTTAFTMDYALATVPTVSVNLNGAGYVTKAVGIQGIDTGKDWYWNKGSQLITQDSAGTKLRGPTGTIDLLKVVYVGQYPTVIIDQNNAQISYEQSLDGTTGIVEEVESDATISSIPNGLAKTSALLTRYAAQGTIFEGMTMQTGYAPGQLATFDMPDYGLYRVQMLIEDVSASDQIDGLNIWYTIKAVQGPYDVSWVDFFKVLFKSSAPSNSINVGVSQSLVIAASGSVSLSPSVTGSATVIACPVPSLTTFPSLTLFPC